MDPLKLAIIADKELMVYEELKKGEESGRYKVHIKEEFPLASHYAANDNVQELIVVAEEGYGFTYDMSHRIRDVLSLRICTASGIWTCQSVFL